MSWAGCVIRSQRFPDHCLGIYLRIHVDEDIVCESEIINVINQSFFLSSSNTSYPPWKTSDGVRYTSAKVRGEGLGE